MIKNYIFVGVASAIVGAAIGIGVTKIVESRKHKKNLAEVKDTMAEVNKKRAKKEVKVLPEAETAEETSDGKGETDAPFEEASKEDEDEEEEYKDHLGPYRPSEEHPYLITESEWEANDGRDKLSVYFYQGDERAYFVDSGEELDVENDLGRFWGNLEEDRFLESEDGVIYIRNPHKSEDYAVDLYPGSSEYGLAE